MTGWLVTTKNVGTAVVNIVKSLGPILISQSDKASEAFVRHKARLAVVDISKELIIEEGKACIDIKKQLHEKYIKSEPDERIRIISDIEQIDKLQRKLNITQKALMYLPEYQKENVGSEPDKDISPHWIDKFNELATNRNEDWRAELLAKALATEASNPGSISPRLLWLIGTLEEKAFHAFATLLNISSEIENKFKIPMPIILNEFWEREVSTDVLDSNTMGNLVCLLEGVGLLADTWSTRYTFVKGEEFIACYFENSYLIKCKNADLNIKGVMLTQLGDSLSIFCEREYYKLGEEIFNSWIQSLDKSNFEVNEIPKVKLEVEKD